MGWDVSGYQCTASVLTEWTGAITVGGYTVTPRSRESVVSLMARITEEVYVASLAATGTALRISWSVSSTGVLTITGDAVFVVSATNNTATRTGFTGTYTGATTYTAAAAFSGAYVPTVGLSLDLPSLYATEGGAVADGTLAWSGPENPARATLTYWTSYADAWPAELQSGEVDVWGSERLLGRVFVERFRRVPPSRLLRSGVMQVQGEGVATYVAQGLPMEIPEEWPAAQGWLYSWVDTSVPGYRTFTGDLATVTVASGYTRFDVAMQDVKTQVDAAAGAESFRYLSDGRLEFIDTGGGTYNTTWTDRLGWLMGFGVEAGTADSEWAVGVSSRSRFVPPGGIPCLGVSWSEVEVQADAEATLDKHRRRLGFVYGAARLWRLRVTMTRWALQALLTGWCLRGKITAVCGSNTTAIGPSEPGGAITGYVLGLDRVSWLDPEHQRRALVELTVSSEGA